MVRGRVLMVLAMLGGLSGSVAFAHTDCDDQCEAEALQMFDDCVAALGENPTEDEIDVCEDEARAFRNTCQAACPDAPDDPNDPAECEDQCEEDAGILFDECVGGLGENPTEDEIDVCEDEARAARDACEAACPLDCDAQCDADADQVFEDCVAALGEDPSSDDINACQDAARIVRDECRALCPDDDDDEDQCGDQCEADAEVVFQACLAGLGENPTEDEVNVCEDEARAVRDACEANCPVDCHRQCRLDARQFFDVCESALGEDPTDEEEDACKDGARALRDACRALCDGQGRGAKRGHGITR